LKIIKASRWPNLDFIAGYQKQGTKLSEFSSNDDQYTAGLSLAFSPFPDISVNGSTYRDMVNSNNFQQRSTISLGILDGSSTKVSRIDLEISLLKLQQDLRDLDESISSAVLSAYETQSEAWLTNETEQLKLGAAEENNRIQNKSYQLGLNQFKDVVDARVDVISAKINQTYARYRYTFDRANLDYVIGYIPGKESR